MAREELINEVEEKRYVILIMNRLIFIINYRNCSKLKEFYENYFPTESYTYKFRFSAL